MLQALLALAMMSSPCSIHIGVSNEGNIFFDRFSGWGRISSSSLEPLLQQGCRTNYSGAPEPITSLLFSVAPRAPQQKVKEIRALLQKNGWPKERLTAEPWNINFRKLSGRFYLDKPIFAIGEPVLLHYEVTNSGSEPFWLDTTGLPGMPFCSGYQIELLGPDGRSIVNNRLVRANTCILNGQLTHTVIHPGAKYTQEIDLGLYLDRNIKGSYVIRAGHRRLRSNGAPDDPLDTEATFKFELQ